MFNDMPEATDNVDSELLARWEKIHAVRDDVKKALELARAQKVIGASLDASVTIFADGETYEFLSSIGDILPGVLIVSDLAINKGGEGEFKGEQDFTVTVKHAEGKKCARCWAYSNTVGTVSGSEDICERCARVLEEQ
jgi:isoleucyl-tRNA synthetase